MYRSIEQVLGISDAAELLGAHEQTVRRMARRGAIPAFKVGKDWRFRRDALERWIEKQQSGFSGRSVLIVDDEELFCKSMARMLTDLGCRPRYATSGAQGINFVFEGAPALVLLDLNMPDMTGPEFLVELRKEHPDLPVVIVTGYPDGDLMHEASRHAPLLVLAKPVEREQLERTLNTVLGSVTTKAVAS